MPRTIAFLLVALQLSGCSSKAASNGPPQTVTGPPSAPVGLTAAGAGIDRIDLTWVDTSSNELGFVVESASDAGGPFAAVHNLATDVTTFSDGGLTPGTARFYRVSAFNEHGSSDYSNVATATTAMDTVAAPAGVVAAAVSSSEIDVTWQDRSSNEQGFRVEGAGAENGPFDLLTTTEAGVTSYAEKDLAPATTRFYRVTAFDAFATSPTTTVVSATSWRAIPHAPANLSVTAASESSISLGWDDASDTEDGYVVEHASAPEGPFTELVRLPANTVTDQDQGLAPATSWSYRVGAFNESGTSYSDVVTGTTLNKARGLVTFHEVSYPAYPVLGKGLLASASFSSSWPAPAFEESPGSSMGCKAWQLSGNQPLQTGFGEDAGVLTFDGAALKMPSCLYFATTGYLCPWGEGIGGTVTGNQFQATGGQFDSKVVGSYLILGDIYPGAFYPITFASNDSLLALGLQFFPAGPYSGPWVVLAGRGPAPWTTDPGDLIANGASITVSLGNGLGSIKPFDALLTAGDPFQLDATSASLISSIPLDGSPFTLGCAEKTCGKAQVSALVLDTTNLTVSPQTPFFPFPSTSSLHVECISAGAFVAVPEKVSSLLSQTSLTRVRAAFFRSGLDLESGSLPVLAGHGYVGFTDPK